MSVAADLITGGAYENALVIGAETLSRITDWTDRNTCVLFGDGAGAVLLQAKDTEGGVLSSVLGADGSGAELLRVPAGGSKRPASQETLDERLHFITMKGREVFRFAVRVMPEATRQVVERADLTLADISLIVPHQANQRIIQAAARSLDLPEESFFCNLERYGNTSAASIPIALCEAAEAGRIARDDTVVCVGFGAGLTWAAAAIRWSAPLPAVEPSRWGRFTYALRYRYAALRSMLRRWMRWLFSRWTKE
jgi:3-oxoacyl-[acyl-carrier-protein] synthase-3